MKIKEITKILETLPQDAQVEHLWYGAVRGLNEILSQTQYTVHSVKKFNEEIDKIMKSSPFVKYKNK